MKAQVNFDSLGGGKSGSLTADLNNELGSITTNGGTYTASDDCIMLGNCCAGGTGGGYGKIYADSIFFMYGASTYGISSQYSIIGNPTDGLGIFVPKGTVISTDTTNGVYNLHFYATA